MRKTGIATWCAVALLSSARLEAQTYKVVVPQLSPATTDIYKSLATALMEAVGAQCSIEVLPFARGMKAIEDKQADLLLTHIANPNAAKAAALSYDDSTVDLFPIAFVMYTNKNKPVDVAELKSGNPKGYLVETDSAHTEYFPFRVTGSASIDAGLQKVDLGRIDAYVFAQPSSDAALKRLGLKNVRRQFYGAFAAKAVLQKGARGGPLDKLLTTAKEKAIASGKFKQVMDKYVEGASKYQDWQP